MFFSINI